MPDLRAGQLVSATRGRDRGKYYLVLALAGDRVVLVNGASHPVERPKKKNHRHVQAHPLCAGDLAEKFAAGSKVDNSDIVRRLRELTAGRGDCRACPGEGGMDRNGQTGCD